MNWEIDLLNKILEIHNPILSTLMRIMSYLGSGGMVFILIALVFLLNKKQRKLGISIIIALIICGIIGNIILKPLFGRVRPYIKYAVPILISHPTGASFPSGHTYSAFATAMCSYYYDKKLSVFLFIFAIIMGFSRLYLYVHYPTDVFAGAILGIVIGIIANKIVVKIYKDKMIT